MIYATCTGTFIHMRTVGERIEGRVVLPDGSPMQFVAKRSTVRRTLESIPIGIPISISGRLETAIKKDKNSENYIRFEMEVSSIQTAQPMPESTFTNMLKKITP